MRKSDKRYFAERSALDFLQITPWQLSAIRIPQNTRAQSSLFWKLFTDVQITMSSGSWFQLSIILFEKLYILFTYAGKDIWRTVELLGLWTLEERWNRQDIIEVFKIYRGYISVALQELFEIDTNSKGIRGTLVNLKRLGAQGILHDIFFE